jgi:hypothetical protein
MSISAQALSDKFGSSSHIYSGVKGDLVTLLEEVRDETDIKEEFDYGLNTFKNIYEEAPDLLPKNENTVLYIHKYLI